jgi:hypothetical protein
VQEIAVDKLMASPRYPWVSQSYWRQRCRNFYLDAPLLHPDDVTDALRPYLAFYRLVAVELGLSVVSDADDLEELHRRKHQYVEELAISCNEEQATCFRLFQTRLLDEFSPFALEPDFDAYNDLCERVFALND